MSKSVIIDAVRSPIGVKNGNMVGIRPDDLTAQVVKGLLTRNENVSPNKIEDFVLGCAFPEGPQGMLMAKGVAILSNIPETTGGSVINRFCGSSMDAVHQISTKIESGDIDVGIAAGIEDMFSVPMGGFNPDFHPELAEQEYYIGMGETAETLAEEGITSILIEGGQAVLHSFMLENLIDQIYIYTSSGKLEGADLINPLKLSKTWSVINQKSLGRDTLIIAEKGEKCLQGL